MGPDPVLHCFGRGICVRLYVMAWRTERRMERYLLSGASARLVMTTGAEAPQMVEATGSPAMQVMLL